MSKITVLNSYVCFKNTKLALLKQSKRTTNKIGQQIKITLKSAE